MSWTKGFALSDGPGLDVVALLRAALACPATGVPGLAVAALLNDTVGTLAAAHHAAGRGGGGGEAVAAAVILGTGARRGKGQAGRARLLPRNASPLLRMRPPHPFTLVLLPGTNAAYCERVRRVPKWPAPPGGPMARAPLLALSGRPFV